MSSGYGLFYNLSSLMGPILGGILYDSYDYRGTLDINMIAEAIIFVIFLVFNCGPLVFKNNANQKKEMLKMKDIGLMLELHDDIDGVNKRSEVEAEKDNMMMFSYNNESLVKTIETVEGGKELSESYEGPN